MSHYREDHLRILTLIAEQRWLAFGSDDEGLLRACVYSGLVAARPVRQHPGKTRLSLTLRGLHYLDELQRMDSPPLPDVDTVVHRRRAVDRVCQAAS
ncbi:hypothetical protein SFA35_14370 [Pseudomonas sp. HR96]|uniref:hypothetical protein n=1 Tax=Pseudomonas sp. HR96 TaxID=1027966 RepID=UPI002A754352|nr:hypothetical protein [Pseudomonas sp. HR96]WPO97839.1 hypothetical protein SFA35_14370 [Pseudomonas sp. HR96]